jgi:effector-binding domain-containing protein
MIEPPHILQIEARRTAIIPLIATWEEMPVVMGPTIRELLAEVAAQGIAPAGPWFTHHLRRPTDTFDFEVSIPVSAPVQPHGRLRPSEWPAMRAARTVYQGPYEGLGEAWGEFIEWLKTNGHQSSPELWECYLVGPESEPDPANWRTELTRQLM